MALLLRLEMHWPHMSNKRACSYGKVLVRRENVVNVAQSPAAVHVPMTSWRTHALTANFLQRMHFLNVWIEHLGLMLSAHLMQG